MFTKKNNPSLITAGIVLGACAMAFSCLGAFAQDAKENSEEKSKVWGFEAKIVANQLEVSDEKAAKLAEAYKKARADQAKAIKEERAKVERWSPRGTFDINQIEKAKLEKVIKDFLDEKQTATALASLGTFSTTWDTMLTALHDMKLEKEMMHKAIPLVTAFVVDSGKAMEEAAAGTRMKAGRDKVASLKEKLDAEIAKIISAEQLAKWKEAMSGSKSK